MKAWLAMAKTGLCPLNLLTWWLQSDASRAEYQDDYMMQINNSSSSISWVLVASDSDITAFVSQALCKTGNMKKTLETLKLV